MLKYVEKSPNKQFLINSAAKKYSKIPIYVTSKNWAIVTRLPECNKTK